MNSSSFPDFLLFRYIFLMGWFWVLIIWIINYAYHLFEEIPEKRVSCPIFIYLYVNAFISFEKMMLQIFFDLQPAFITHLKAQKIPESKCGYAHDSWDSFLSFFLKSKNKTIKNIDFS